MIAPLGGVAGVLDALSFAAARRPDGPIRLRLSLKRAQVMSATTPLGSVSGRNRALRATPIAQVSAGILFNFFRWGLLRYRTRRRYGALRCAGSSCPDPWCTTRTRRTTHRGAILKIIFPPDTLHPSWWVKNMGMNVHMEVPEYLHNTLDELAQISEIAIRTSQKYGRAVIITNAETGWAELSCRRWLPRLLPLLQELTVLSF